MASEENVPFDPTSFEHIPVLLNECLEGLAIDPAGTYLDGTAGGAGHSRQIALRLDAAKGGRLISLDQDPDAVQTARARLAGLPATVVQINFRYAGQALEELGIDKINGALLDLGVSSHQLDDAARGFSYRADAPLDMRMSQQGETAADLVNTLSREDLARILRDYGEEPFAWQIAGKIEEARENAPIETTLQLADIVASAMPPAEVEGHAGTLVDLAGIAHLVIEGVAPSEDFFRAAEPLFSAIEGLDAYGVIFLDRTSHRMTPLVKVVDTGTLIWEGSCGSGTIACAVAESAGLADGLFEQDYFQPAGVVRASIERRGGAVVSAAIGGPVTLDEPMCITL